MISRSLVVVVALLCSSVVAAPPAPAAPTPLDDKVQALALLARLQAAEPADSLAFKLYGQAITISVMAMTNLDPQDANPQAQQRLEVLLTELKNKNVDVGPGVRSMMADFQRFGCRGKQSEAKGNLKALYVGEESYRAEFDTYDKDTKKIGFEARGSKIRYRYEVVSASPTAFLARATGIDEMKGDVWEINEKNELTNTKALCTP